MIESFLFVFLAAMPVLFSIVVSAKAVRNTYHVATTGSDDNPGTSALPFLTIQKAASVVNPGDTVIIRSGIYLVSGDPAITITRSGSSGDGTIVFKSEVAHGAKIVSSGGYDVIKITANYIEIQGLDISATNQQDGHCIESEHAHHTRIIGNRLHDCGGSGFQGNYGDYYHVEGNIIYSNSKRNVWATSGISIYQARAISDSLPGFHNIVRNNICFDNIEISSGTHTDGNGIIIDDFQNTQNGSDAGIYPYETLVENNLVYHNGGKGIQIFLSNNVIVRNNTAYGNNRDNKNTGTWRGEINVAQASNVILVNNIAQTAPGINALNSAIFEGSYNGYIPSPGNVWKNNLTFNGTEMRSAVRIDLNGESSVDSLAKMQDIQSAGAGNHLGINPLFVSAGITEFADFRLQAASAVIDMGTSAYGLPPDDLDGNARIVGNAVDLGAYEYGGVSLG